MSPSRRRRCVAAVCEGLGISERRACRALGQHRSTQRHTLALRDDEDALTAAVIDEYTRECLAIVVARRLTSHEVLMTLADLFLEYGVPEHIRSESGSEFIATAVREWLAELGVTTLFIEPASPWENGYIESFNGKLRDEPLDGEIFYTLKEAQILVAGRRRLYNGLRPHSALGQRPPAPETITFPGFSLSDYAPPASTQEVAPALT